MTSIKLLRKVRGISQAKLSEMTGLAQPYISQVEKGDDGITLRSLRLIAQALDVPLYQLFVDDTTAAEMALIEVYRSLPDDRKQGWRDMAMMVKAGEQSADQ